MLLSVEFPRHSLLLLNYRKRGEEGGVVFVGWEK